MMTRQLDSEHSSTQHHVLQCLKPWMENLVFSKKWEGTWTERLLKCLYYVTWKHGQQYPYETQQLWRTVGSKPSNVMPIIDFILTKGMEECMSGATEPLMEYLAVAKRIVLYVGQCSPQKTNDELVSECAQLINEEDDSAAVAPQPVDLPIFLFQMEDEPASTSAQISGSLPSIVDHTSASAFGGSMSVAAANMSKYSSLSMDEPLASTSGGLQSSVSTPLLISVNQITSPVVRNPLHRLSLGHLSNAVSSPALTKRRSRTFSIEEYPSAREPRPLLSRPQLTLCLLAELAYHHDEDFRNHLPVLLLVCIINMDSAQPIVSSHAQQVIVNLLYSMSARHLEVHTGGGMTDKYQRVIAVMRDLQAAGGSCMWAYELNTIHAPNGRTYPELARLVRHLIDSMFFEPDLRTKWAAEALNWSMHLPSPYLAARCQQVLRALTPPLSPEITHSMLTGLLQCLSHPSSASFDFMAELLLTLKALVEAMPAHQVKMYPQLLWGTIALLHTSHVPLFSLVLQVLHSLLRSLQLWNLPCQQILAASAPSLTLVPDAPPPSGVLGLEAWILGNKLMGLPELSCVQQLLFKGMLSDATRSATVAVLTQLLKQVGMCLRTRGQSTGMTTFQPGQRALASGGAAAAPAVRGMDGLLGKCSYQVVTSIIAGLPWMLRHRLDPTARDDAVAFTTAVADACTAFGAPDIAPRISAFTAESSAGSTLPALLSNFAASFMKAFFPEHAEPVLVYLTLQLLGGPPAYHDDVLHLLKALFQAGSIDTSQFSHPCSHAHILTTLSLLAQGDRAPAVLDMLDAVLENVGGIGGRWEGGAANGAPGTVGAIGDADDFPPGLIPISEAGASCENAARSLLQCMQSSKASSGTVAGWRSRSPLLPFTTMYLSSELATSKETSL